MASVIYYQTVIVKDPGTDIVALAGAFGKGSNGIDSGQSIGGALNIGSPGGSKFPEFGEQLLFQSESLFLCSQNAALQLLEFGSNEAFGIDQSLFAHIIIRDQIQIGFADFDIVPEN